MRGEVGGGGGGGGGRERGREGGDGGRDGEGRGGSHLSIDVAAFIQQQLYCGGVSIHSGQHEGGYPQFATSPAHIQNTHKTTPIQPHPHNAPRVDICPFLEQQFDDVHVPPRGSQGEWSVIRDIPMLKVGPLGQQKLDNLTRSAKM